MDNSLRVVSKPSVEGSVEPCELWEAALDAEGGVVEPLGFQDEVVEDLSVDHYRVLREEAINAQRLGVSRNAADHYKGSAEVVSFDASRKLTIEKMFKVTGLIDWVSGKPDVVVEEMRKGRLRTRVSAAMGLGKSTVLPSYIANSMGHRVLYVSLDANALSQCDDYIRGVGIGAMNANWQPKVMPWVTCMTYCDFVVAMSKSKRSALFKHFETFIFDEAFVQTPVVDAALKQFAVLALPETNLLLCSANIRTDDVGAKMSSNAQGSVRVVKESISLEVAMSTGKLLTDHLVDRTQVVLPDDESVHDLAEYYEANGVDVRTLDSASRDSEVHEMGDWLTGDSSTPRVMVTHNRFAIAYNFPINFVILWPFVSKMYMEGDKLEVRQIPMSPSMVSQAVARTGRGIVEGSGAMVMGEVRSEEGVLTDVEKFEEFVLLSQSYIAPLKNLFWQTTHAKLPSGLKPSVAQLIRKVNLPAEVTVRYLASDGKFARKFVKGLLAFTQANHYAYASDVDDYPVGYENWPSEGLFGAEENGPNIRVPVLATGEIQVVLHAITAISEEKFAIDKWLPPTRKFYNSGGSDSEESTRSVHKRFLRRVRSGEKVVPKDLPPVVTQGWSYESRALNEELGGRRSRVAVQVEGDRFKDAMVGMFEAVRSMGVNGPSSPFGDSVIGERNVVELPCGEVESPSGKIVCELSGALCQALNSGDLLSGEMMIELIRAFRIHGNRIVISRLFDCFGHAWTSVLLSYTNSFVMGPVIAQGLSAFAYEMFGVLYARYSVELITVAQNSNVYKTRFLRIFKRTPTPNELTDAMRNGRFGGIAQSEEFVRRVVSMKEMFDVAMDLAGQLGVYLPNHVTEAQRTLPIHPRTSLGNVSDGRMVDRGGGKLSMRTFDRTKLSGYPRTNIW